MFICDEKHFENSRVYETTTERMSTPGRKRVQPILIDDDDDDDDEADVPIVEDERVVSSSSIKTLSHVNIDSQLPSSASTSQSSTTVGKKHIFVSLNFDELSHIRFVQAKREYNHLLYDIQLYKSVVNGQICFSCRKEKFSFLHPGVRCGICHQRVCHRCQRQLNLRSDRICFVSLNLLRRSSSSSTEMNLTSEKAEESTSNRTDLLSRKITPRTRMTISKKSFSSCLDCFILFHPI